MMCAPLIMFPLPSPGPRPFSFVILDPPLRTSGQHPRMVKRPDVVGVNLPSAPTVIVIPRARDHVQRSPSLSRDILPLAPHVCKRRPRSYRIPFIDVVRRSL